MSILFILSFFFSFCVFSYGVGIRTKLKYTKIIIHAIHSGSLLNVEYRKTVSLLCLEIKLYIFLLFLLFLYN
jgi:hypothetical protein